MFDNLVTALDELLAMWRAERASELAEMIEQLSEMFEPAIAPLEGTLRDRHVQWLGRCNARRSWELPLLLDTVGQGTSKEATAQLELLASQPADPRITSLAVRMLTKPKYATSSGTQTVWRRLFALVEVHADPRAAAALAGLPMKRIFRAGDRGERMRARAANVIEKLPKVPPPTTAYDAIGKQLVKALERGRTLRDDPQGKIVYLDWLEERGFTRDA